MREKTTCKELLDRSMAYHYRLGSEQPEFLLIIVYKMDGEPDETVDLSKEWGHICTLRRIECGVAEYAVENA